MSSARSHTSGGWPRIEMGSHCRSVSSTDTESEWGRGVVMRLYLVSTRGPILGGMSNSWPMLDRLLVNARENFPRSFARAVGVDDGDAIVAKARGHRRASATLGVLEIEVTHERRRMHDGHGHTSVLGRRIERRQIRAAG